MKYLKFFNSDIINENVLQAKSLLKKNSFSENDPDFLKIRELLKGHDGYVYWFTKLRFIDNKGLDELTNIWNIINDKSGLISHFTKKIVDLESLEEFWDEYEKSKLVSKAKKLLNQFPANQKKFLDIKNTEDFDLLLALSDCKSLTAFIRKISSYRDKKSLVEAAKRLIDSKFSGKFGDIVDNINSTGATIKVTDEEENIIICQVNYEQIKKLGGDTSWCIVGSEDTFNSYVRGGFQWIIFLIGESDRMSKIGFTTNFDFVTAHDKYDGYLSKEKIKSLLSKKGIDLSDFFISKEILYNIKNWDSFPVELLIGRGFTKQEIVNRRKILKDKSKYSNIRLGKNDIDFFTEEEIKKWNLIDFIEMSWSNISKMKTEDVLSGKYLSRLDNRVSLVSIMDQLKISKEDVIKYGIFKFNNVVINDLKNIFSFDKETLINSGFLKFISINYILSLDVLIKNGFTKKDILDNKIQNISTIMIDDNSISHFTRAEILNNNILDRAYNLSFNSLMSLGFKKSEILTKYSDRLNRSTSRVIDFFKGKKKAGVLNRLKSIFYREDKERLTGESEGSIGNSILIALSLYDINSDFINLSTLGDILSSTEKKLEISQSSLKILYSLGFKITDNTSYSIFKSIFGVVNYSSDNTVRKVSRIIEFRSLFSKDSKEYEICTNDLSSTISNLYRWISYYEFDDVKSILLNAPESDLIISQIKKSKLPGGYSSNFKTGSSSRSNSYDAEFEPTVKFMEEVGVNKEDIESVGLEEFTKDNFRGFDIDKIFSYYEEVGFELNDLNIKKILKGILGAEHSIDDVTYCEKYYKELLNKNIDIDDSLTNLLKYLNLRKNISDEESYRKLFQKGGEEWITKFEDILVKIKDTELKIDSVKSLRNIFDDRSTKSLRYNTDKERSEGYIEKSKKWYDTYFNVYKEIKSVNNNYKYHGYDYLEDNIKCIWLLASLDKLDEIESVFDADKFNDKSIRGFSFDGSILHSFCKLLSKSSSREYEKYFKDKLTDEQNIKLYKYVLSKVDENEYWVKRNLMVCYYLYEKDKYDKIVSEIPFIKNNYKYNAYDRRGEFKEVKIKTLRIDLFRYILKYFLKDLQDLESCKDLVNKVMITKESNKRDIKMSKTEFKNTIEYLDDLSPGGSLRSDFSKFINQIKTDDEIKESVVLKWSQFIKL